MLKGSDGVHRPVTWDQALMLVTGAVKQTREQYGPDAVGVFGGGGLTNEKAYQLGKFARLALGTSRIDYNGRFCMSSAAAAGNRAFGVDRASRSPWKTSIRQTSFSFSAPTSPRPCHHSSSTCRARAIPAG
ncbi:assimilatory nitrate reductase catalytic subunit [Arthrobacter sp. Hiyo8]|nr:assimilatory nitrate reductase catalytic subunit [Arthrobacter sp. Hiyo8]